MSPVDGLPEALRLAREARLSGDPMSVSPYELWHAAQSVRGQEQRRELYRHAMIEAGHIISNATGEAYIVCPECGWRA